MLWQVAEVKALVALVWVAAVEVVLKPIQMPISAKLNTTAHTTAITREAFVREVADEADAAPVIPLAVPA